MILPVFKSNSQNMPSVVKVESVKSSFNFMRVYKDLTSGFSAFQIIVPPGVMRYRLDSLNGNPVCVSSMIFPSLSWIVFSICVKSGWIAMNIVLACGFILVWKRWMPYLISSVRCPYYIPNLVSLPSGREKNKLFQKLIHNFNIFICNFFCVDTSKCYIKFLEVSRWQIKKINPR